MSRGRGGKKRLPPDKADPAELFDGASLEEVNQLFNKVKTYSAPSTSPWCLPHPNVALCDPPWTHPPLQALKESLNEVKNRLSDKDLPVWHQHTCSTNRAGRVTSHLRETVNAELCTQAWAKFYEILGTFPILPERALRDGELNSVHLCEAPGAFISALNHFLQSSRLHCDWNWVANTLNPYHEANGRSCTIADDRLIAHTLPWWFFGSDDTGDIMLQKHLLELSQFVSNMRSVDLVTADGSFDCQGDPGEQESLVAPLQYCEAICALLLLGPGGSLVLKMFTLLEHASVCLLYLLACCFSSVHVFKPATSKAGNSEVYVVCVDYNAKDRIRPLLSKLIRNYGPGLLSNVALFPKSSIPPTFLEQHREVCQFFHALQISTIQENLLLFGNMIPEQRWHLDRLREGTALFYVRRFQIQPLPRKRWVCRGGAMAGAKQGQRKQTGSFNQRKEMQFQEWRQRLAHGADLFGIQEHSQEGEGGQFILTEPPVERDLTAWDVRMGASLRKVCSSPFCDQGLLDLLNEALLERDLASPGRTVPTASPACPACRGPSPADILEEVCGRAPSCTVVVGDETWSAIGTRGNLRLRFLPGPRYPAVSGSVLHDANRLDQHKLLSDVLTAIRELPKDSALVVPLCSALTRFSASLVLALHLCFQSVSFRCPLGGPPAVLLCAGFSPVPQVTTVLQEALVKMEGLNPDRQVLQFAPMEDLIRGPLPHFLSCLNNTVLKRQLHFLFQGERR